MRHTLTLQHIIYLHIGHTHASFLALSPIALFCCCVQKITINDTLTHTSIYHIFTLMRHKHASLLAFSSIALFCCCVQKTCLDRQAQCKDVDVYMCA